MEDERPKRRRWFQFRLRTLLIIVLVLSLPLAWLSGRVQKASKQRKAIELLERKGCNMLYTETWLFSNICLLKQTCVPVYVAGSDSRVTDTDLRHLRELSDVEGIELDNTAITDAGLEQIGELTNLKLLSLDHTRITDDGLRQLSRLKNLKALMLEDTSITDNGMKHLTCLTNLEFLVVAKAVTNHGVKEVKQTVPNCRIYAIRPTGRIRIDEEN